METTPQLTARQIPVRFARCFQSDCPKAPSCLRFLAGTLLPAGQLCGPAVYPTARSGEDCAMYRPAESQRLAYGFTSLLAEVKSKDQIPLRRAIKDLLGGNTAFYRYQHGRRLLLPAQQEQILALFRERGYSGGQLRFDAYRDAYDFTV